MRRFLIALGFALIVLLSAEVFLGAGEGPAFTRTRDVIYGRKYGLALTLDVFTPKKANGVGVILVVSGGWFSGPQGINTAFTTELLKRGYTVFAVVHGSQPKFTVPEIVEDMNRAVRFIRARAADYKIDPERLGIMGGSAGGHLSLMQGTSGTPGNPKATDPVERASSRVQAVACFFPPTDFLNYGEQGRVWNSRTIPDPFKPALDFHEFDRTKKVFLRVTDEDKERAILRKISPVYHVTAATPPTLIIHGDADKLVPIQQAEVMLARLKEAGIPAELVRREGADHGWLTLVQDVSLFADWFDRYLRKAAKEEPKK
jgi:acetyl esterase/lipase